MKLAAGLVTVLFASALLAPADRPKSRLFLGVFLALIAANQLAEAALATSVQGDVREGLRRAAAVFAALDPLFLVLFMRKEAGGVTRLASPAIAGYATGSALLAAWAILGASGRPYPLAVALATFTAVAYTHSLLIARRRVVSSPSDTGRVILLYAVAVATIPIWIRPFGFFWVAMHPAAPPFPAFGILRRVALVHVLLVLVGLQLLRAQSSERRADAASRRSLLGATLAGLGMLVVVEFGNVELLARWIMEPLGVGPETGPLGGILGRLGASLRWLAFGVLASMAIARHDLFGLSLAARRRIARGVLAGALFVLGASALVAFDDALGAQAELSITEMVLLLGLVAVSQTARRMVDRVALTLYGVPPKADPVAAAAMYSRAAAQASGSPGARERLDALRAELELDAEQADSLERALGAAGPLTAGALVADRYRVEHLIGRGGAGRVFRAWDETLARSVALKEVLDGNEDALREASLLGSLDHPNIVKIYEVVRRPGMVILVMEFAAGGSLAARVDADGPIPWPEAGRILDGILAGLAAAHERGVVHQDVKAANVLLAADGTAKIADFGIARLRRGETATMDHAAAIIGSKDALAPEQLAGKVAGPAADVYALGVLATRCFAQAPPAVASAIDRALSQEPAARWGDAGEMRAALTGRLLT